MSLESFNHKSGVYLLSPEHKKHGLFLVKIGTATSKINTRSYQNKTGLQNRLEQYLLYYPRGFYVFGVLTTSAKQAAALERSIHQYLIAKKRKAVCEHTRCEEWFWLSVADMHKLLEEFQTDALEAHDFCLAGQSPFHVDSNPGFQEFRRQLQPMSTPVKRLREQHRHSSDVVHTLRKAPRTNRLSFDDDDE